MKISKLFDFIMNCGTSLAILLGIVSLSLVCADRVPVLLHFKNSDLVKDHQVLIGHDLSGADFQKLLSKIPSSSSIEVIQVPRLNDQDLVGIDQLETDRVVYEPSVNDPLPILESYLTKYPKATFEKDFSDLSLAWDHYLREIEQTDVVILTGKNSRLLNQVHGNRVRREAPNAGNSSDDMEYVFGKNCALMFQSIYIIDQSTGLNSQPVDLDVEESTFNCDELSSTLTVKFNGNASIFGSQIKQLNLIFANPNNSLNWQVTLNSTLVTASGSYGVFYYGTPYGMQTPDTYSFACTKTYFQLVNTTLSSLPLLKVALYIDYLQAQPFGVEVNGTNYTFGQVNYCQGFFSNGIWMGITSSLLLTAILAFGVLFLFGIRTMDKLDDPKGKPLTIAIEK